MKILVVIIFILVDAINTKRKNVSNFADLGGVCKFRSYAFLRVCELGVFKIRKSN